MHEGGVDLQWGCSGVSLHSMLMTTCRDSHKPKVKHWTMEHSTAELREAY